MPNRLFEEEVEEKNTNVVQNKGRSEKQTNKNISGQNTD